MDVLDPSYKLIAVRNGMRLPKLLSPLRTMEEVKRYAADNGLLAGLPAILGSLVGYQLFKAFLGSKPGGSVAMEFIEAVCGFQCTLGETARRASARAIVDTFGPLFPDTPFFATPPPGEDEAGKALPALRPTAPATKPKPSPGRPSLRALRSTTFSTAAPSSTSHSDSTVEDVVKPARPLQPAPGALTLPPPLGLPGSAPARPPTPRATEPPPALGSGRRSFVLGKLLDRYRRVHHLLGRTMKQAWLSAVNAVEMPPAGTRRLSIFDEVVVCLLKQLEELYLLGFATTHQTPFFLAYVQLEHLTSHQRRPTTDSFHWIGRIGKGGYGAVFLAARRATGHLSAIKCADKRVMKLKHTTPLMLMERQALAACDSPFVLRLRAAFQTDNKVFLATDLYTGGDLHRRMQTVRRFPEAHAKFYAAEVLLALNYLHERGIMHRDVKPSNVFIAGDGHVALGDLGLAVFVRSPAVATPPAAVNGNTVKDKVRGRAGTEGFWAPEMLARDSSGRAAKYDAGADFWSFGAFVYCIVFGKPPFPRAEALTALEAATHAPLYPEALFSPALVDLLTKLFAVNPARRLGCAPNGIRTIMRHPWFADVNWNLLSNRAVPPPWVPKSAHLKLKAGAMEDMSPTTARQVAYHVLTVDEEAAFDGMDFACPRAAAMEVLHNMHLNGDMEALSHL